MSIFATPICTRGTVAVAARMEVADARSRKNRESLERISEVVVKKAVVIELVAATPARSSAGETTDSTDGYR